MRFKSLPLALMALTVFSTGAAASSITYGTPAGSLQSGQPVDATAAFTTNDNGTISITLTNLEANPTTVAQNISDLLFTLSNGTTTSASLTSSSGQDITINDNGTSTLGSTGSTGWGLDVSPLGTIHLDDLGFDGPEHTIIGPGPYTNANGSIAGNNPHNPFINQAATFTMAVCAPTEAEARETARESFEWYPKVGARQIAQVAEWMEERKQELGNYGYAADMRAPSDDGSLDLLSLEYLVDTGACVLGTPDQCVDSCKRYEAAGVDLLLCLVNPYKIGHEQVMQTIDLMGKHVIPNFS